MVRPNPANGLANIKTVEHQTLNSHHANEPAPKAKRQSNLAVRFRRMTGQVDGAGTHPSPGVLQSKIFGAACDR
ncbi:MAG: hypothetical protein DMF72_14110 [Acidobacteria bacterium]|nr:MAG: hypothetical protein DMF72_14110 [Acidobacteriota bacterium]